MAIRIKKGGWTAIGLVLIFAGGGTALKLRHDHPDWFKKEVGVASAVPQGAKLPGMVTGAETTIVSTPVYAVSAVQNDHTGTLRTEGIAWNGEISAIYANGGANTTPDSLMAKGGVKVRYVRQDNYDNLTGDLVAFAQEFKNGNVDPSNGAHFVVIMGDAAPYFLKGLQDQLDEKAPGMHAKIIGASGFSRGEDKCMGPPEWAKDPQKAKGGLVAAVIRDGDWNICVMWAQANGLKINPDFHTYDPEALNFASAQDFVAADNAYLSGDKTYEDGPYKGRPHGACEERSYAPGTGFGKKTVCVQGVATWTPGDTAVVDGKGGVVGLLSTRENASQMAATFIVIDEWAQANRPTVTNFLQAIFNAGTEVQTDRAKLRTAADMSAKVWGQESGVYWSKLYTGFSQPDPVTGETVKMGGSQAVGLASNVAYFMPGQAGGKSIYQTVYDTFCKYDTTYYPKDVPNCPANPVDTSFIEEIAAKAPNLGQGSIASSFTGTESQVVASASYSNITFDAGSARIRPESEEVLNRILGQLTIGSNLAVQIDGYTSSEGNADENQRLSEARAKAVKQWLMTHAARRDLIPDNRIRTNGYGAGDLVKTVSGQEDRVASRRVKISLASGG
jgi:outer membrane protein OmpA-like peptidoglycan-associated protein